MDERTVSSGSRGRLAGIDAARALAIIGMFIVHFGPKEETDLLGRLYALPHGRASILFVLVAGVGISLLAAHRDTLFEVRLRMLAFAMFLLPVGLALELLNHPVAVILHHYAAFFLLGIVALGFTTRALAICAGIATILGPLLFYAGMMVAPNVFDRGSVDLADTPVAIVSALIFTGPYPLIVWSAPLLWGMWIGRHDLGDARWHRTLMAAGVVVAVSAHLASELAFAGLGEPRRTADWRVLFTDTAHSEMPLWVISAIGAGCFVLGATLAVARALPRVVRPLADLGFMALTVYVVHVLSLTFAGDVLRQQGVIPAIVSVTIFTILATAFAVVWRQTIGRGPVERAMHGVARALADIVPATPPAAATSRPGRRIDG